MLEIDEHDGKEDEFGNDHRQTVHMIERQPVEKDHGDHVDHLELAEDIGDRCHYLTQRVPKRVRCLHFLQFFLHYSTRKKNGIPLFTKKDAYKKLFLNSTRFCVGLG